MADNKTLHIAMFPWLAFGHILPFFNLSKLIAQKGHKISFISTPRNIDRLPKLPPNLSSSITLVKIPMPKLPGLPENAEATVDIGDGQMDLLKKAFNGLESGLTRFLEETRPDWIVYDFAPYWLPLVTARLGIPGALFIVVGPWLLGFLGPISDQEFVDDRTKLEDFTAPPKWIKFETKVAYRRFEAKWILGSVHETGSGYSDAYRVANVVKGCEAILLRDCYEFEPQLLGALEELFPCTRIISLGFVPPAVQEHSNDDNCVTIRDWLDGQDKESVVYVALGSEVIPSQDQLTELAHGLELSKVPFFWVLRKASGAKDSNSVELPEGFEERVKGRGIVWRSWVPQLEILSHDSVGGFLTHTGWGSLVEGLMFGLPLISLPFLVEQGLNSRLIAEKELGVEIPRNEEDGSYTRDSVADSVKMVMVDNDGKKLKENAKRIAAIFGDKELHENYIDNFIDYLKNHPSMLTK